MIFVDRGRGGIPKELEERAPRELAEAAEVFERDDEADSYARYSFKSYRHRSVKDALHELFSDKCAYCENRLESRVGSDIEHFRPKQRCVDEKGDLFPLHYWWLALEWSNLYLACRGCNSAKKNRFPIAGERADPRARESDVAALARQEQPVLLDPCLEQDNPEAHFVYTEDGVITSDTTRGRATIEICALNRRSLVEARKQRLDELLGMAETAGLLLDEPSRDGAGREALDQLLSQLKTFTEPDRPFAGMCRQFTRRLLDEAASEPADMDEELARNVGSTRKVDSTEQQRVAGDFKAFKDQLSSYSLEEGDTGEYYLRSHTIQKVVIRNFRPIQDLTLELGGREEVPWMMLLGENGCGKSSVLKAIAVALMGEKYRNDPLLELDAQQYLRRGEDSGFVEVWLSGMEEPIVLEYKAGEPQFSGGSAPKVLLLAYGATRLLPRKSQEQRPMRYARVDNLFDPFIPLRDANAWLLGLPVDRFESLKPALKKLLNLGPNADLLQNHDDGAVEVTLHGDLVPLDQLSDGYQCVVALAAEVMSILMERWEEMAAAEGIVLLDEVGSHLHPSWKMKIVSSLRETFPAVQFIVSSHDPLCLRGMQEGEVWVMGRSDEGAIIAHNELPNPEAMRVDQILQSDFFNMSSTVDDRVNDLYDRYYELLSNKKRDSEQEQELSDIRGELARIGELGDTDRERMMLEVIDEYRVERQQERTRKGRADLREETRDRLKELWSSAVRSRNSGEDSQ